MKFFLFCFILSTSLAGQVCLNQSASSIDNSISFTENKGQISDQFYNPRPDILFGGITNGMSFYLGKKGVSYQLNRIDSWKTVRLISDSEHQIPEKSTIYRLDLSWVGANNNFEVEYDKCNAGYNNYYLQSCPNGALNVRSFTGITYKNIYDNIDVHFYQNNGTLKYDYIIAPYANYKKIRLQVEGANKIEIQSNGSLMIETPLGRITEDAPYVIQRNKKIPAQWIVTENSISFLIDDYDPRFAITIDPAVRVWGTYYGGSDTDEGFGSSINNQGDVFMAGRAGSSVSGTNIATSGSHQYIWGGGTTDAFICKFNSAGVRQWGTFYGGSGEETGNSCKVDHSGDILLIGSSSSTLTIATSGAHQTSNAGVSDAFIVKFNTNGFRIWGTYYGDQLDDFGRSCSIDEFNNIYMTGETSYTLGTVLGTTGCHQTANGGGVDAFLVKLNSNGVRIWGTYYGGSSNDYGYSCELDSSNNVYLTGQTESTNAISTSLSHQLNIGGLKDAYFVKFNSIGTRLWGTYYGGSSDDVGKAIGSDGFNKVYLTGNTSSFNSTTIATPLSHQSLFGGSTSDSFLIQFDSLGNRNWGTYYGGGAQDYGTSIKVNSSGDIYMCGYTASNTGTAIATNGSHQFIHGGVNDGYLAKFNSSGIRSWGTFYGGIIDDAIHSLDIDSTNNLYVVGSTIASSGTTIATPGSHASTPPGSFDAFLIKFNDCSSAPAPPVDLTPSSNLFICANNSTTLVATASGTVYWYSSQTSTNPISSGSTCITTTLSPGQYTFYASAYTCTNSLTKTAITLTVDLCTSINKTIFLENVNIFPNPTKGIFTVTTTKVDFDSELEVYNSIGELIQFKKTNSNSTLLDLSEHSSGMYFIKIKHFESTKTIKIIKE